MCTYSTSYACAKRQVGGGSLPSKFKVHVVGYIRAQYREALTVKKKANEKTTQCEWCEERVSNV